MEVEIKRNEEQSEIELKITATVEDFAPYVKDAAKKLSKEKSIKGFRPGKAPVEVVEEVFGPGRLLNEAMDRAIPRFFVEAVLDNDIDAIARPKVAVDEIGRDKGLRFTATVAVLPTVTLGDLSKIEVEKRAVKVTEKELETELERLTKMRSTYLEVARPAVKGDVLIVDFKITTGGVMLEGGQGKDQQVHLGEGHFVPDFEDKLIGIAAGDVREFKIKFPVDYKKRNLAGKEAEAWVQAKAVQKRVVPEINDAFAQQLGKFENLIDLKKQLRDNLQHERKHREEERQQGEMTEKLAEGAAFSNIHEVLIDKEIDRLLGEFEQMLVWQQKTIDDYCREKGRTIEQVREEMKPNAEKSVKVGLALRSFAKQEGVQVDENELAEKTKDYLKRFSSSKESAEKIDPEELREHLTYLMRNQKAMELLETKVTIKEAKDEKPKE